MFAATIAASAAGILFTVLLALAARADLRARRIPNRLVGVIAAAGLVLAATALARPVGLPHAALGLLVGLALWLPLWLLGGLGAGDVKLAAACGAWLGPWGVLDASLLAMLAGGLLALGMLARRRALGPLGASASLWVLALRHDPARALRAPTRAAMLPRTELLPYGVALAIGALLAGWLPAAWLPLAGLR